MDSDPDDSQAREIPETPRKRLDPSSPAEKKSNKKKKQKQIVEATIQVVQDNPERAPPLVGYFPSGFDPNGKSNGGGESSAAAAAAMARVYRNRNKPKRLQLVVSPNGSNVDFVGTNYSGEAEAGQQHCNYALGVLDKETQTLKIVPIASNKIIRLEPKVRGSRLPNKDAESLAEGERSAVSRSEKMKGLTERYGTSKAIRAAKKWAALKQDDDPETQKDMNEKIKQIAIKKEALESTQVQVDRNIPPYNAAATSPQEAYPLEKIILKGEWDFLEDIYQLLEEEAEVKLDAYPSFISNRIQKLREIENEEEKKRKACIFSYITHLIKFKDLHSMDGISSAKRHMFPSILRQKFSSMFGNPEAKNLASEKNDLLISYVLVLTLYADQFQTNPSDIAKDLRMNSLTVRVHYKQLGCKLVRQKNLWFATLPVPLHFPELKRQWKR